MQQVRTFTEAGLARALELTNRALELVGEQALLHATQALVHWQYHNAGIRPTRRRCIVAEASADRAIELDAEFRRASSPRDSWPIRGDAGVCRRPSRHGRRLDGNSDALTFLSYVCALADRPDLARAYADQAIDVDPLNPWALWGRGMCELVCGDLPTAVDRFRRESPWLRRIHCWCSS